jgi:hypothetical protein
MECPSTIDGERYSGNERRLGAGQEKGGTGNLDRLGDAL